MKKKPYIGITGFMSPEEVSDTLKGINFQKANRLLMVGVLASSKSLKGITNKWPGRYPSISEMENIFLDNENCLNLVHFNTKEPENLLSQLLEVTDYSGENFNGFQLNIAWPSVRVLEAYKKFYEKKCIVLQIGGDAFNEVSHSPQKLADKVHREYADLIDYVLLDPSDGTGKPFDPIIAKNYLEALGAKRNNFGLGVAGGLSPTTLNLVEPLVKDFPELCIDAEGRLRTIEDELDVQIAIDYVQKSLKLFSV
ncbi:MAG: hypothetical protein WCT42_02095 [Candidatus Paceibacterota bacterium]